MKTLFLFLTLFLTSFYYTQEIEIKVHKYNTHATLGISDFETILNYPIEVAPISNLFFKYTIDLDCKKTELFVNNEKKASINIDSTEIKNKNILYVYMTEKREGDSNNPFKTMCIVDLKNKQLYYMWYDGVLDYTKLIVPKEYSIKIKSDLN